MACEVWSSDAGPCGGAEVERLWFVNEWMDHPGHGQAGPALGLGLCAAHLATYRQGSLL